AASAQAMCAATASAWRAAPLRAARGTPPRLRAAPPQVDPRLGQGGVAVLQPGMHLHQLLAALDELEAQSPTAGRGVGFDGRVLDPALVRADIDRRRRIGPAALQAAAHEV